MPLKDVIARVRQMEGYLDLVLNAMENTPEAVIEDEEVKEALHKLADYYENGQWFLDYEIDEQGLLPKELKRGVLAEDTLYNLLDELEWRKSEEYVEE